MSATPIPKNGAPFTAEELHATGLRHESGPSRRHEGVSTDSRTTTPGNLYVALEGERFDGHQFVGSAVAAGATGVLVADGRSVAVPNDVDVWRTNDTLDALGVLARHHRERWGQRIVAVAGSAGKTTTRSAIGALLGHLWPGSILEAPGNLNNRIGVPMVVLGLRAEHRFGVLELGTNRTGEVAALVDVCRPDVAVLTLIDWEHAEGLGDLEAIEMEEGAIVAGPLSLAIGNGDCERVRRRLQASPAARTLHYGERDGSDYQVTIHAGATLGSMEIRLGGPLGGDRRVETGLVGYPGALATAAAVAVADWFATETAGKPTPVPERVVSAALRAFHGVEGRLRIDRSPDGILVVDDTYNANPGSMASSLRVAAELARQQSARLGLILGEMLELGPYAVAAHETLGRNLAATRPDWAIFVGPSGPVVEAAASPTRVTAVDDWDAASKLVRMMAESGDVVLVKGSRGIQLEHVASALRAGFLPPARAAISERRRSDA